MTDKDQRPEHQHSPEQLPDYLKKLDLVVPNMEWQQDLQTVYNLSPKKEAMYKQWAQQFANSSTVIVVTGLWGMGDSVMSTRFAIHMARETGKNVVCQVHPALVPFAEKLAEAVPNIQLVQKVPESYVQLPDSFIMRFIGGGGRIEEVARWAEGDPQINEPIVRQKKADSRTLELENLTMKEPGKAETFPEPFHPVQNKQGTFNTSYYFSGFVSECAGVPVTAEDIRQSSIFELSAEEVQQIPQDLDCVIIPDAKEFPDENDYRSYKSFDPRVWEIVLNKFPKDQKVGIVMGVSHPNYCQTIINLAEKAGLQVEVLSGDLLELSRQLLRAKKIAGMDSGTTHLSKDVETTARKAGRQIDLKPLFNAELSHFEQYGIVDVTSYTYGAETVRMANQVADFILS